MTGKIFNIQKFCVNDGPGIRTTVFFKGCPLKCLWCHNPESQIPKNELLYNSARCIGCGNCVKICNQNAHKIGSGAHTYIRENCINCGKCSEICYSHAIENAGKEVSVTDVIEAVMQDKAFYDTSGGGITLSGGEPLMQYEFALELLKSAKEKGIHTCIETCGFTTKEKITKISQFADIFLFDYKLTDDALHKKYTGVGNKIILDNLFSIDKLNSKIILRCPIIPDINNNMYHFEGIAHTANSLSNIICIDIEPYHSLGDIKYKNLDMNEAQQFRVPQITEVDEWLKTIQSLTKVKVKKSTE